MSEEEGEEDPVQTYQGSESDGGGWLEQTWNNLALHPKYCSAFAKLHQHLLTASGPLSPANRHFVAIMASSRHLCNQLIHCHYEEFIAAVGGALLDDDQELKKWLESRLSIEKAPAKLRQLDKINRIMAHRPWMLTVEDIRELSQPCEENDGKRWSLSEVMQGVILLAHFHALSSLVMGCAVFDCEKEPHDEAAVAEAKEASQGVGVESGIEGKVDDIKEKMETLMAHEGEELEVAELKRRFEKVSSQDRALVAPPPPPPRAMGAEGAPPSGLRKSRSLTPIKEDEDHFESLDPNSFTYHLGDFHYVDFAKREHQAEYPTFKLLDYNWENYAHPTVANLSGEEMAIKLDTKFKTIDSLTYMTIGSYQSVDTSFFRRAIHSYVQCLYGIRQDDYNYNLINELLPIRLKNYIKTVSCCPERCSSTEYQAIMKEFQASEKVHVCLLICEARLQAELLYACRAISSFFHQGPDASR